MKIHRSITNPVRVVHSWDERWGDIELGLITSWERGRTKAKEVPDLAIRAVKNELVMLPWKGGFDLPKAGANPKKPILATKYGVFNYLAMWQGLRNEDLCIDTDRELSFTCPREKRTVIFTSCYAKYANSVDEVM